MKRIEREVTIVEYASEIHPELVTENREDGETIAWADANPVVWKIVMQNKSQPFGSKSSTYMGCDRGDSSWQIIARAMYFQLETKKEGFFGWRARWTMEHYGDKGFTGGLFQQFDGKYDRGCGYLDYTPKTLDEVVEKFVEWCDSGGYRYPTRAVRINGKTVKKYPEKKK